MEVKVLRAIEVDGDTYMVDEKQMWWEEIGEGVWCLTLFPNVKARKVGEKLVFENDSFDLLENKLKEFKDGAR